MLWGRLGGGDAGCEVFGVGAEQQGREVQPKAEDAMAARKTR